MKQKISLWDITLDKLIDGLFIFIGVYVAFYFNQWQEERILRKELYFNLSQIMRSLPDEEPKTTAAPFKIDQGIGEDGECSIQSLIVSWNDLAGKRYLDAIVERGLGNLLANKDKHILGMLSLYYDSLLPQADKSTQAFFDQYTSFYTEKLDPKGCLSDEVKRSIEKQLSTSYASYKMKEVLAAKMGHAAFKELRQLGVPLQKKKSMNVNFQFSIEEEESSPKK
ncbi:MAG: hypothetical protein HRT44_06545 [Bdellovibrionales bacterium]|nr:hypothetical protein [Bdellovibrionales bacterium]NQZ18900.1 hypothetical protein [Bdellovibrionales bacterium]